MELIVFHQHRRVAQGEVATALAQARRFLAEQPVVGADLLVLDRHSARLIEVDFSLDDGVILKMLGVQQAQRTGRGRPKLGVQSREVSLLPRHWQWLNSQPGGASSALRRLVEAARRSPEVQREENRQAVDRFLQTLAGDLPNYEEALRQFYRGDYTRMTEQMSNWPADVVEQTQALVAQVERGGSPAV
ncbi:DUF2239 family protein [Saccharospirillum mangrovi]|uniref:DUF2239 family protein n=1 Tax=Saccharospirillum mangrovi TaxID=2161747 RepID=UPI0018E576EC|nr:DUF2239 family protein [Saccharospirillum mangrovi]